MHAVRRPGRGIIVAIRDDGFEVETGPFDGPNFPAAGKSQGAAVGRPGGRIVHVEILEVDREIRVVKKGQLPPLFRAQVQQPDFEKTAGIGPVGDFGEIRRGRGKPITPARAGKTFGGIAGQVGEVEIPPGHIQDEILVGFRRRLGGNDFGAGGFLTRRQQETRHDHEQPCATFAARGPVVGRTHACRSRTSPRRAGRVPGRSARSRKLLCPVQGEGMSFCSLSGHSENGCLAAA